ncbi:MAG: phosphotransferase [Alphaproteobacteria bacterium]|nr:phosphotransferase [Alphaproteobacteria bacterium]
MTENSVAARHGHMLRFIEHSGWAGAELQPLAGDASTRRYVRLVRNGRTAMLMDQPRGAETATCPPSASAQERRALGYNAMARLAGPDCRPFAALSHYLRGRGLSAPEVLAHDYELGFLLIEDFGDGRFADLIAGGRAERPLYEAAINALVDLHAQPAPSTLSVPGAGAVHLLGYDAVAMEAEVLLLPEWFIPAASGAPLSGEAREEYVAAWRGALAQLTERAPVVVLRDYHAENLMWMDQRTGIARAGLLDFQDALAGSPAYDLISLVEDARRDVSVDLAHAMTRLYIAARKSRETGFDEEAFRFAAALLAAQRNTKIVGIFARLWKRDGKPRYTAYLPRMWGYLDRGSIPRVEWSWPRASGSGCVR